MPEADRSRERPEPDEKPIDAASVDAAITSRRSVRAFLPDPVPRETIEHILDVAARAPSGTNIQPWFVHVLVGEARERLCRAVLERREQGPPDAEMNYYPLKWFEPYLTRRRTLGLALYGLLGLGKEDKEGMWAQFGRNYLFFDAPVGMIFTMHRDLETGSWMDMGMFLQNVMIAARAQGLHTCPQAAWNEYPKTVAEAVGIPDEQIVVCGMALGHEDTSRPENALRSTREPCAAFTRFLGFDA